MIVMDENVETTMIHAYLYVLNFESIFKPISTKNSKLKVVTSRFKIFSFGNHCKVYCDDGSMNQMRSLV